MARLFLRLLLGSLVLSPLAHAQSPPKQALKPGVYWLVYDTRIPGALNICTEETENLSKCEAWNPALTFFRSGTFIRLEVIHGKMRSTYNIVSNGMALTDNIPEVRYVSTAPAASQPSTSTAPTPSPGAVVALTGSQKDQFDTVQSLYEQAESSIGLIQSYEGTRTQAPAPYCSPRSLSSPGASTRSVLEYATILRDDAAQCDDHGPNPFIDETMFNNLTDRADRLVQSVSNLNADLPSKADLITDIDAAQMDWQNFQSTETMFLVNFPSAASTSDEKGYLSGGDKYEKLLADSKAIVNANIRIPTELLQLNDAMAKAFSHINAVYDKSESPRPFDLPLGQYGSNYAAEFEIHEVSSFIPYSVMPGTASQQTPGSLLPQGSGAPVPNPFGPGSVGGGTASPASPTPARGSPQANPQPVNPTVGSGKTIYTGNFDVHHFYRANIVAGFFVSTLKNREYGISNNGQANANNVAVIGEAHSPQVHYFVGLNYYFEQRDLFPGALTTAKYFIPGFLFGYGLDATNNFLLGLNWEAKWGMNFAGGYNVGQESFLQPGIVPGVTVIPSGSTSPPTVNRFRGGGFFSFGFDLSVVKAAFSQLFTGGGGATQSTPAASPGATKPH